MTTNRNRWVVWRDNTLAINWINPWVAAARDPSGYGYAGKFFPTHAEALAYADKMARTVEIVLPRDNTVVPLPACMEKEEKPITLTRWGEQIIIECTAQGVEEVIFIHDDELKPLALALLAHHYRNQP
ncbi:hypothetical protein [Corynebacterium macclintockiae]|uniref:hypothetical protein n=1 Tax=Corynebacterium macclintockiae TaxID=2913501 RepID=UPI003EBCBEB7